MPRILPALALLSSLALTLAAHADTIPFDATGIVGPITDSGQLFTSANPDGSFTITGISAPYITGLLAPGTFASNNNLLFPSTPGALLDGSGFAFTYTDGSQTYLGDVAFLNGAYELQSRDPQGNLSTAPINFYLTSSAPAAAVTPEPTPFILVATAGLLLFGFRTRRRPAQTT